MSKITPGSSALVVFSGGQDSTTMLYWAKAHFERVETLCFKYGQNHSAETLVAESLAHEAGVGFKLMDLSFIGQLSSNALTHSELTMDSEKPSNALPNTFVPGRNLFFLSAAAVYARELGISDLVTGVSQTDFSGYPDCRDSFIKSLNVTLNLAMEASFRIHTPLMWLDKCQTWELADQLGVFELVRTRTLTCYRGVVGDGCGHCPACVLRRRGLEAYLEKRKEQKN